MQDTWILIADGAKATCYLYQGQKQPLKEIESFKHVNAPSRDLTSTERGRMPDPDQGQRSAMERPTDPHEHEKLVFAKKLGEWLNAKQPEFDRLIIAASAGTLGSLRQCLSDKVADKTSDELDKDLTNVPEAELPKHLQSVLNIDENPGSNLIGALPRAKPI